MGERGSALHEVKSAGAISLRRYLLTGILLPVGVLIIVNTASLYRQALSAVNTAYDRTLLASAKSIGEQLGVTGYDEQSELRVTVPYAALEAFEADNQSRLFYRVSSLDGKMISGFAQLPFWRGKIPMRPPYSALVDFYDDEFREQPVRVAVLLQPVASSNGRAMAVIQVAETLELRQTLARKILFDTLWRQAVLLAVIAMVVVVVVQRATRPVRRLSAELQARHEGDLTPIAAADAPRELLPLIEATNQVMGRLQHLLDHQKRFVRDAAHQLRTPLAVLKVQVQSALRGDMDAQGALAEVNQTVDRATVLANQMLALAKVEQLRQQADLKAIDLAQIVRAVALDVAPLIADKDIDFEIETVPALVTSHEWMLGELTRNLLHNAIKHTPAGGTLSVRIVRDASYVALTVSDSGPGISAELAARLYQPFSAGNVRHGSGLGLAICREITEAMHGGISLENRVVHGRVTGLDATVRLPAT
ncbi:MULTISPECIES: sensor histidine kinase [unclassified Polaromonas]|uniref:sensor histidine kinase n=1 Tax=unclassified Polaromonas TaxID=2638319 RepID=UPI000F09A2EF|nr:MULTISPECIES: sensor histidine kinase [unclassified Polaromonas]AYQ30092.1 sensor histidine kinase [Polaromonas sp. SP1]QGJ18793.1 HAMP domain-containing protein [Polaromonas sp. Pch-P]